MGNIKIHLKKLDNKIVFLIIKTHYSRTKPPCQGEQPTPKCKKVCESSYPTPYKSDKHFGKLKIYKLAWQNLALVIQFKLFFLSPLYSPLK